jgi:hypothetical protein
MFLRKSCLTVLISGERLLQMTCHLTAGAGDFIGLLTPGARNAGKDISEGWHVIALYGRKIGARIKGFRSGVRNTDMGQPPEPVIATVACM